jgi:hypothetical protein
MDAREVIMLQLPLLSLMRTEEELVPVNVPARAELPFVPISMRHF